MAYLLDANVFIGAKELHYGFDFCPAFWDWLLEANARGTVFSIEKVEDELHGHDDALSEWATARGPQFFLPPDPKTFFDSMAAVSNWAVRKGYETAAVDTFLRVADCYLVAQGLAEQHTIITHEKPANSRKIIKVPDACVALRVKCMNPFEMLRREHARFVLGPSPR